jgi:quinoprotein glucose dehydrogenase
LKDGRSHAGVVKSESATELVLQTMEDGIPELVKLRPADVKTRDRGLSSMPEELGSVLTKRDVRNLVEFLATLK